MQVDRSSAGWTSVKAIQLQPKPTLMLLDVQNILDEQGAAFLAGRVRATKALFWGGRGN